MIRGSCLCQGIAFEIVGAVTDLLYCHCKMCRKWHGSAFRARGKINTDEFRWCRGSELIRFYESSSVFTAYFCLENAARELIGERLASRHGADWWSLKVPSKIKQAVEKLKEKEVKNRYHTPRSVDLIGYTLLATSRRSLLQRGMTSLTYFPIRHG